jgi:hypothetical protein
MWHEKNTRTQALPVLALWQAAFAAGTRRRQALCLHELVSNVLALSDTLALQAGFLVSLPDRPSKRPV